MTHKTVPLASLLPPKGNPRRTYDPSLIEGLAESIKGDGGMSHLFDAVTGLMGNVPFAEYGNAFVYTWIMGLIAWLLYFRRDKWTYFAATFSTALTLLRATLGLGLIAYSGAPLPTASR